MLELNIVGTTNCSWEGNWIAASNITTGVYINHVLQFLSLHHCSVIYELNILIEQINILQNSIPGEPILEYLWEEKLFSSQCQVL